MKNVTNKLHGIIESESFFIYKEEQDRFCMRWQYFEPASLNAEDRFELDKEAYIKTFITGVHFTNVQYEEKNLLNLLIDNIQKPKHPVWVNYLEYLKDKLEPQPIKTKVEYFKEKIKNEGFYNLEKVKSLSLEKRTELIGLLCSNMSYGIAMFDFLGFCSFLDEEQGSKKKANIILSRLYNKNAKDDSQARHYRNSLVNNKPRYKSYNHIEKVKKDYEKLK